MNELVPADRIEQRIFRLRSQNVMLDEDLAELYELPTKRLNEQARRNRDRFPEDFMFQLTAAEAEFLRSQIATLKRGCGEHRKYLPYAFTQEGVTMLSNVLRSKRAVYPLLDPRLTSTNHELVFDAIRKLMEPPPADAKRRIGFRG